MTAKKGWRHPNRRVIYVDDELWKKVKSLARHRLTTVSELIRDQLKATLGE